MYTYMVFCFELLFRLYRETFDLLISHRVSMLRVFKSLKLGLCFCGFQNHHHFRLWRLWQPWMKELKGIIHRGEGAFLRCPVSTSVQFSLRDEGSTEYMCVRGKITGENIYRCQSACPVVLNNFDLFKENKTSQSL